MTTWVLLRGLMRESRHWGDFPAQLQQAVGGRVLTPDLPGNGSLHGLSSPCSVREMTDACREQLHKRGHAPPYDLLAMSMGAMVAVDWAARYPQELRRMVLINTSLAGLNPLPQRLRPRNYAALVYALLFGDPEQRERLILRVTSNRQRAAAQRDRLLAEWCGYARSCPVTRRNILRQLYAAARYRAVPDRPALPILMLASSQDALVDVRCSRAIAAHWGIACVEHPIAGHDLPLDDGAWVVEQVRLWSGATT